MSKIKIGYAGLTHLGISSAAAAAEKGFQVMGFHDNANYIADINNGRLPIVEPGLDNLVRKNLSRLTFSSDAVSLADCDIVYISVDVPTDGNGKSDLKPIDKMIVICEKIIKADALMVILCQVPPGFTRQIPRPTEFLYYQVETLIFGRAVERATKPERLIIGCNDPDHRIDARLEKYLETYKCPILPMRYESAELAKISINMCLVASLSVANTMAEICENVGADWSEIVPSLKFDERIGKYSYLKPGLGIAGGNLERDLNTVIRLSEQYQTDSSVISACIKNSEYRKDWVWRTLNQKVLNVVPNARIGVLGLAYKENTHSTKNSPSLALLSQLNDFDVLVHDPVVSADKVGVSIKSVKRAEDVAKDADVLIILTPWPEYRELDLGNISTIMKGQLVIDPYAVLNEKDVKAAGLDYFRLGVSEFLNHTTGPVINVHSQ